MELHPISVEHIFGFETYIVRLNFYWMVSCDIVFVFSSLNIFHVNYEFEWLLFEWFEYCFQTGSSWDHLYNWYSECRYPNFPEVHGRSQFEFWASDTYMCIAFFPKKIPLGLWTIIPFICACIPISVPPGPAGADFVFEFIFVTAARVWTSSRAKRAKEKKEKEEEKRRQSHSWRGAGLIVDGAPDS